MKFNRVVSIILGGGRGTRLYPLTRDRAKPAVPLAGKYRLIDIPISNCINSGINQVFVLTQFLSASLHRHVYDTYKFDIFSRGFVELLPAEQTLTSSDWYQGTADAVRRQLMEIMSDGYDDAVILAGDHLYRMDYSKFIKYHRDNRADVTLGAIPVSREETSRFGVFRVDASQKITSFYEKPKDEELLDTLESLDNPEKPFLASMGIYVFRMEVLDRVLKNMSGTDFGGDIIPDVINSSRVFAYPFNGYWEDIGTVEAFYKANLRLTQPDPEFDFYDPIRPIFTRSRFLPPSRVDECHVVQSVICDGCKMFSSRIEGSVIGQRAMIRPGCSLAHVVMMGADYYESRSEKSENIKLKRPHIGIGNNSHIQRAIIDKNARVGQNVIIRSHVGEPDQEGDGYVIRDGIVVIPKGAVIPDAMEI